ncbi:MAG: hypothetical protein OSJ45_15730 [Lachnospiraceae bacterium]|nr:hypothetical protein [Lachnospiraceae bacterium]
MAMEINGIYNNVYESTYTTQKQETEKKQVAVRNESSEKAAAQKNSTVGNDKVESTADYAKKLEKLVSSVKFRVGSACVSAKNGKSLTVSPQLLEKMQNDPEKEKDMRDMIKGVEVMSKLAESITKASGWTIVYQHSYIDENGKYHCRMQTRNDGMLKLSDKLREERRKNSEKLIEKSKEKATDKREELQEALEENKSETEDKKTDGEQEEAGIVVVKEDTPMEKVEQMLLEKLENSENGEIYLNDNDMRMILDVAKEKVQGQTDKVKNPVVAGNNFDLQI